ncbi:MAG: YajQ family cyclic di-GMP-binding protein [Pelagibacteraceae bacterium]|nr:YajQ family cyclic di-GMP-binding protein [Pelagibacteraceae bacterium]
MPSFDVVSKANLQEIDNAINNTKREVDNRFDFKNSNSTIERKDFLVTIETTDNTKLNQFNDIFKNNIVRRKIDPKFIHIKDTENASGNRVRQHIEILNGISKEDSKLVTNIVKSSKLKLQTSIQGDEVRVTGKKIDDLQSMIDLFKSSDIKIPLQYINFRD